MAFYHGADGLILASRHGHLNAVKTLLRHGARLTTEAGYGSALEEALAGGHHEVVRLLLEKGARNFGFGLFGALEQGHMEVFEVVAESGIPLGGFLSRHGESLLERAIRRKKDEIAKFLLGMGVKPIDGGPLVESVARGDAELTQLLIKHGANPNQVNGLKRYPLGVACSRGHRDIIEILLKHGADLAITDVRGWSCVDWANHGGHKKLIGWLDSIGRKKRMTIPRRGK
jgi:ankyrin repeat protein